MVVLPCPIDRQIEMLRHEVKLQQSHLRVVGVLSSYCVSRILLFERLVKCSMMLVMAVVLG